MIDWLRLLGAVALALCGSAIIARRIVRRGPADQLIVTLLVWMAQIVLIAEAASLLGVLGGAAFAIGHGIVAALAVAICKPSWLAPASIGAPIA